MPSPTTSKYFRKIRPQLFKCYVNHSANNPTKKHHPCQIQKKTLKCTQVISDTYSIDGIRNNCANNGWENPRCQATIQSKKAIRSLDVSNYTNTQSPVHLPHVHRQLLIMLHRLSHEPGTSIYNLSCLSSKWCGRKGIRPVKMEWWGTGIVICLEIISSWCHCHPIVSCSSKIQNGLLRLSWKKAVKWM